jgi:hypothetical protein
MNVKLTNGQLYLYSGIYSKATPLELSVDLLAGEWANRNFTVIFTKDGTYTVKSAFPGVDDKIAVFSVMGSNTVDMPENGGNLWAFLSETATEYQLVLETVAYGGLKTAALVKRTK